MSALDKIRDLVSPVAPEPPRAPTPYVEGGFGTVPGAESQVPMVRPPGYKMTARDADRLMAAEMLEAMRNLVAGTTELSSAINRHGATNGVLRVGAYTFDASGAVELNHPVTVGSVMVHNPSGASTVTVQLGPGVANGVPGLGQGFQTIPAGAVLPIPIGQKSFVVYGTAGQSVNVQAFTGLQAYGASL